MKKTLAARAHRKNRGGLRADVACFGMLIPSVVMAVDQFPDHNTGALITQVAELLEDDAAIVACVLRGWKVRSGLIGTALGDDPRGRQAARALKELGVLGKVRLFKNITTPFEVDISDRTGARTYFWQREERVLDTLDTADLSLLRNAQLLYVDWYDGDHILRPMEEASRLGVPVFLNLEYGHQDPHVLDAFVRRTTICQTVTDPAQHEHDALSVASKLLNAGAQTALVTLAEQGCIAATRDEVLRASAPSVPVVDCCGAGASFSAGFIYGHLRGWSLEDQVRFAVAAGSLKCTHLGIKAMPLSEIKRLARQVQVDRLEVQSHRHVG